jgi:hypothetical protein
MFVNVNEKRREEKRREEKRREEKRREGKGREGKGREGKGREGKKREEKRREEKRREEFKRWYLWPSEDWTGLSYNINNTTVQSECINFILSSVTTFQARIKNKCTTSILPQRPLHGRNE